MYSMIDDEMAPFSRRTQSEQLIRIESTETHHMTLLGKGLLVVAVWRFQREVRHRLVAQIHTVITANSDRLGLAYSLSPSPTIFYTRAMQKNHRQMHKCKAELRGTHDETTLAAPTG
jgi:hypothetical protein